MKYYIFFFFLIIILIIFLLQGIYLPLNANSTEAFLFFIEKGDSVFKIAEELENQNFIKSKFYFELYVFLTGNTAKLKAGKYLLSKSMSIPEIIKKIVLGNVVKDKITIIEGWNLRDIGWYFEEKGMFQAEELFELVGFPLIDYSENSDLEAPRDFSDEFNFLEDKPISVSLEGYLFPDTYEILKDESLEKIIKKMLENFNKKVNPELREEITLQEKTIFEILIMASMLEKEVKPLEDKKIASGILWKRLNNGILLQVDATIAYITGEKTTKISKEDMEIDSSYNTYKYKGLPLGPICNPGLESIEAAIYPQDSAYWYYLSAPTGETIFSKTLQEHNLAKAKYLK